MRLRMVRQGMARGQKRPASLRLAGKGLAFYKKGGARSAPLHFFAQLHARCSSRTVVNGEPHFLLIVSRTKTRRHRPKPIARWNCHRGKVTCMHAKRRRDQPWILKTRRDQHYRSGIIPSDQEWPNPRTDGLWKSARRRQGVLGMHDAKLSEILRMSYLVLCPLRSVFVNAAARTPETPQFIVRRRKNAWINSERKSAH